MHACLALGFEGIHRTSAGGAATLQQIQRNLYETLRRVRSRAAEHISPRWQGQRSRRTPRARRSRSGRSRPSSARCSSPSSSRCASCSATAEAVASSCRRFVRRRASRSSARSSAAAAASPAAPGRRQITAARAHPRRACAGDRGAEGERRPDRQRDHHPAANLVAVRLRPGRRCSKGSSRWSARSPRRSRRSRASSRSSGHTDSTPIRATSGSVELRASVARAQGGRGPPEAGRDRSRTAAGGRQGRRPAHRPERQRRKGGRSTGASKSRSSATIEAGREETKQRAKGSEPRRQAVDARRLVGDRRDRARLRRSGSSGRSSASARCGRCSLLYDASG